MAPTHLAPLPRDPAPRALRRSPARRTEHLIRTWRRTCDRRYRTDAIETGMPLARGLARRYHPGPEPWEDLLQVAYLGLVKAIDRFDPDDGARFSSFAVPTITGELRRHFRDTTWAVHVPRGMQEETLRLRRSTEELNARLGRAPTVRELSEASGLSIEAVADVMHAQTAKETTSLERPSDWHDGTPLTLGDTLGDDDEGYDLVEHRVTVEPVLRALPQRDRMLLFMRFGQEMTQTEIAERLGCSQMQVSRLLRRVLAGLRKIDPSASD